MDQRIPVKNSNHPKKGAKITVEPIRQLGDVKAIAIMLWSHPRNHLLFVMGVNNGLRIGDLLRLTIGDVSHLRVGETLRIKESKTGKENILVINKRVYKALQHFLNSQPHSAHEYLFASRKGQNIPLTISAVNRLVKKWTRAIHLYGNYGTHTLRKTWGYHQRVTYGAGFEIIAKRFNHSSPAVTMRYLGIEDKEVHEMLMNEIG
jgi:integrase